MQLAGKLHPPNPRRRAQRPIGLSLAVALGGMTPRCRHRQPEPPEVERGIEPEGLLAALRGADQIAGKLPERPLHIAAVADPAKPPQRL